MRDDTSFGHSFTTKAKVRLIHKEKTQELALVAGVIRLGGTENIQRKTQPVESVFTPSRRRFRRRIRRRRYRRLDPDHATDGAEVAPREPRVDTPGVEAVRTRGQRLDHVPFAVVLEADTTPPLCSGTS
jgi:hypothetical protein